MKLRQVKITGIGPVTPAGVGREEFARGIFESRSRVRPYTNIGEQYGPFVAAYIDKFDVGNYLKESIVPKGAARHSLFAIAGAALALQDAGITLRELREAKSVVVVGSSLMDFDGIGRTIEGVLMKGVRGAVVRTVFSTNAAVIPATIIQVLGLNSRCLAVQTSCCAGLDAIGQASRIVASGEADIAICGGTEAPLFRCPLVELRAAGLTPNTSENHARIDRPFDLWRTTGVVSEGACMFTIEPESSPRKGYGFVAGYGYANDVGDELCSGMLNAIKHSLADAGTRNAEVDSINAWGPGHRETDAAECAVLGMFFGRRLASIPAVSIKGAIGNPLGAAPAIQVAAAALSQQMGMVPPTVNWEFPDPSCPLRLSSQPRSLFHEVTLVNAHGLSGVNSSIVIKRC